MSRSIVDQIADAILYEGYLLYPYRASSLKNRHRFNFGMLYPRAYCAEGGGTDAWLMQTQCLLTGDCHTHVDVRVRFLQAISAMPVEPVDDSAISESPEFVEREVTVRGLKLFDLVAQPQTVPIAFPPRYATVKPLAGAVKISNQDLGDGLFRLCVQIENRTAIDDDSPHNRDEALAMALISTHAILGCANGEFLSSIDPPDRLKTAAQACQNIGLWPVLVGEPGVKDQMLAAPIILYDYPQIAPESPGDLFDGTEIDEILALRVMTLTDVEKDAVRAGDPRARAMLERTESLQTDQFSKLHGTFRSPGAFAPPIAMYDEFPTLGVPQPVHVPITTFVSKGVELRIGDRIRLRPKRLADIFDMVLAGKTAVIESIEQDLEDRIHVSVTVDDDPGQDFGRLGKPGHRFYFDKDEIEPLSVAGLGDENL